MHARSMVCLLTALLACRDHDATPRAMTTSGSGTAASQPPMQSPREAVALACTVEDAAQLAKVPDEQRGAAAMTWLRAHVTNAEILHVLDEAALDTWPSARARLVALAGQHGVTACALASSFKGPAYPVKLPDLAGPSRPWTQEPAVVVTDASIAYAGTPVVELDHGHVAKAALAGSRIPELAEQLAKAKHGERVQIVFDAATPFETAQAVIASLAVGDVAKVSIVCEQNHEAVLLDVDMPMRAIEADFAVVARPSSLQLAKWARGRVGSPVVDASLDGGMGQILRGLIEQAGSGGTESGRAGSGAAGQGRTVVVVADGTLDVGRVVGLIGALGSMSTRVVLSPGHP
jgi:biopolymer transport protein ExbD